ncbi:MAG: hypothetical protein JNL70_03710 [Saprospiraceae bacterium]|nr:hypothetical protein [Saprospiraceae bacterium]
MKKSLLTVLIANTVMAFTATAPVYSLSVGGINHWGLGVIFGSLAAMNLLAGGGLSLFSVPEGKYFKRLGLGFFVLSIVVFLLPI